MKRLLIAALLAAGVVMSAGCEPVCPHGQHAIIAGPVQTCEKNS